MSANQPPAGHERRSSKLPILAAAVVTAAAVGGVLAWSLTGSGKHQSAPVASPSASPTPTGTPGDQYAAGVLTDFSNMSTVLISYLQTLQNWRNDKVDDAQVGAVAKSVLDDIALTQQALAARQPFPPAPRAIYDYRAAADLYGQGALMTQAATAVPHGALRTQLQLAVARVQTLADRVFDQGAAEMKPFVTPENEFDSVQVMRADEIPSFGAGKFAAGPPLTDVGDAPTPYPYQTTRPEESLSDWLKVAQNARIPTASEIRSAIDSGRIAALSADSVTFTHACDLLHNTPDPQGERIVSTRIQLALLVEAEATQLGQAATLVPAGEHEPVLHMAQALELIGDKLWDDRLGKRDSAYPDSLLVIKQS
ncbi:MAG TPA: hypothetical protein VHV82_13990 [Sporichthyaceae bacterium]|jgi:hypothetical protein|nr:hypothetical protein [Sporichthyaceae bacterium]